MLFDISRKKKDMTLKLCHLIEYYVRNIFMEKSCRNYAPKASPRTLLNFDTINQNSHRMQEIVLKIRYFERGLSKSHKKLTLIFLSNPISFNEQDHEKQKEPETNDQSLIRL